MTRGSAIRATTRMGSNLMPIDVPAQRLGARQSCRVLVVDDDHLVRARISALLNACEYQVESAASGEEAMRILSATQCNIVLTDWQMPDMDGLALCRHVRLGAQDSYVYVVMLTIRDSEDDLLTGLAAGADDYVVKGASINEILARLEIGRRITHGNRFPRRDQREERPMSHIDPSTGTHNLGYLMQHLPRELARSQRYGHALSILSCGIDGYGRVIERFGREAGDELLRAFVARADTCIRQCDWLARTGHDEFMIVLPETTAKGARRVARKLRQLFALHPLSTPADPIGFTVNIAVTAIEAKHDAEGSLQIAALLRAVNSGANDNAGASAADGRAIAHGGGRNELN
jgi:two-component system, cell cycle response regulator